MHLSRRRLLDGWRRYALPTHAAPPFARRAVSHSRVLTIAGAMITDSPGVALGRRLAGLARARAGTQHAGVVYGAGIAIIALVAVERRPRQGGALRLAAATLSVRLDRAGELAGAVDEADLAAPPPALVIAAASTHTVGRAALRNEQRPLQVVRSTRRVGSCGR
jgi:hypothetical protein